MRIHPLSSTDLTALMSAVVTLVDSLHLRGRETASSSRRHAEQVLLTPSSMWPRSHDWVRWSWLHKLRRMTNMKLRTFWVRRRFHGLGIGGHLLDPLIEDWLRSNHDHVIVTVCEDRAAGQEWLLVSREFRWLSISAERAKTKWF